MHIYKTLSILKGDDFLIIYANKCKQTPKSVVLQYCIRQVVCLQKWGNQIRTSIPEWNITIVSAPLGFPDSIDQTVALFSQKLKKPICSWQHNVRQHCSQIEPLLHQKYSKKPSGRSFFSYQMIDLHV